MVSDSLNIIKYVIKEKNNAMKAQSHLFILLILYGYSNEKKRNDIDMHIARK